MPFCFSVFKEKRTDVMQGVAIKNLFYRLIINLLKPILTYKQPTHVTGVRWVCWRCFAKFAKLVLRKQLA
jgi:hypothetical protein